mmetsp:Transcript_6019/g.13693  ORF Transcript_6019/g.13693 Transcript_6019/m.13693 type:complete len:349 (+) Transcript_6019:704-1750(+)
MEGQVRLHARDEHVYSDRELPVLQKHGVDHVLLHHAVASEVPLLQRGLLGVEDLDIPAPGAEGLLLRVDVGDLVNQDDASAHGLAVGLVDPLLVGVGLCVPLPLLQVVGQDEGERVPGRREVDRDVSLDAPLSDQLQHADLREHADAMDPVDQAPVLQGGRVVNHVPAALPDEDRRDLLTGLDHLEAPILLLLHPRNGHAHVVRDLREGLLAANVGVDRAHPVHVAQNRLQEVDDGLRILWGDVVLTLELRLHEATAVDVAREVRLRPAEERLRRHVAREARVLLHSSPRPWVVVREVLGAQRQPPGALVGLVLPLLVGKEGALQIPGRLLHLLLLLRLLLILGGGHL